MTTIIDILAVIGALETLGALLVLAFVFRAWRNFGRQERERKENTE